MLSVLSADLLRRCFAPCILSCTLLLFFAAGCGRQENTPPAGPPATAESVLQDMVAAYQQAHHYQDRGVVRLEYRRGGRTYEDEASVSVAWTAPNLVNVRAYHVNMVCDGTHLFARIRDEATSDFDGQIVVRDAPGRLALKAMYEDDDILSLAFRQGLAGYPIQLELLFGDQPLAALRDDQVTRRLLAAGKIEGHRCYRLRAQTSDGPFVLWIDQRSRLLRRIEYPARSFAPEIAEDPAVDQLQLVVDLRDASFANHPAASRFTFDLPKGAKTVRKFIPPPRQLPSDLFGKTAAPYAFSKPGGGVVSNQSLGKKIKVFTWFNNHPACQSAMQQLNQVFEQFESEPRVAIYGVCVEPSSVSDEQVEQLAKSWQIRVPITRDHQACGRDLFHIPWAPTMVVLDGSNVVHIFEVGANPNLVAELPQVLERLLAGDNLGAEILAQFREARAEYARALKRGEPQPASLAQQNSAARQRTAPKSLRLLPAWKNDTLRACGNILPLTGPSHTANFLVYEGWRTITELDARGHIVGRHELPLPKLAAVSQLQTAVDQSGRRYFVAWALRGRQAYVLDHQWNVVVSYPAARAEHDGIQDALLADVDQDGQLELVVGYWGRTGVQCVSLNGDLRWTNAALSHVFSLTSAGSPTGSRLLWVASAGGTIVPLDAQGVAGKPLNSAGQLIHHLFASNRPADPAIPYCGISYGPEGRRIAVGLTPTLQTKWRYNLPAGSFPNEIHFVTSASLLAQNDQYWLLASVDGSIHIVRSDGRFTDHFQSGRDLAGLAAAWDRDHSLLVTSSDQGLEAWRVLPPATARSDP